MKSLLFLLAFLVLDGPIPSLQQSADVYDEELFIRPLKTGHTNSYFQFTTRWKNVDDESDLQHTHLTSRSLAELFLHHPINELHVSLTSGIWRAEKWGYPVLDAAPGAEIWAWFRQEGNKTTVDEHWKALSGTLSGLLCASLSFVDHTNTFSPELSLRPQFYDPKNERTAALRYATLPKEIVCTENLTPWKKLLPCHYKEGFASLLTPEKLYSTNYHSLGIHIRKICAGATCERYSLEIKQTVNLVQDLTLFEGRNWSIRKFFGQGLNGVCEMARSSKIYIDITDQNYEFGHKPTEIITSTRGGVKTELAVFDIRQIAPSWFFNIAITDKSDPNIVPIISPPPLVAKRSLNAVGQHQGRITTKLSNKHWAPINVVLLENIPWFVPIYVHTLKLRLLETGEEIRPALLKYRPGEQRTRPYHLELAFRIPARTTLEVSFDFDYIFMKWQEYPPDANHGHYIGSAIVSTLLPVARNYSSVPVGGSLFADAFNATQSDGYFLQIRTEALLITLPTPDFSMPYNVICLACTVVALAFGPLHNMTTKKIILKSVDAPRTLLGRLKEKFLKRKKKDESVEGVVEEKKDESKTE